MTIKEQYEKDFMELLLNEADWTVVEDPYVLGFIEEVLLAEQATLD